MESKQTIESVLLNEEIQIELEASHNQIGATFESDDNMPCGTSRFCLLQKDGRLICVHTNTTTSFQAPLGFYHEEGVVNFVKPSNQA